MEFRLGKTQDLDSICLLVKDAIVEMEKMASINGMIFILQEKILRKARERSRAEQRPEEKD